MHILAAGADVASVGTNGVRSGSTRATSARVGTLAPAPPPPPQTPLPWPVLRDRRCVGISPRIVGRGKGDYNPLPRQRGGSSYSATAIFTFPYSNEREVLVVSKKVFLVSGSIQVVKRGR